MDNKMNIKTLFQINILVLGVLLFLAGGCSSQSKAETEKNKYEKVDVVTAGIPKAQTKSFGEHYAQAVKSSDAWQRGSDLNKKGQYQEAIEAFNQSLSLADSTVSKAIAYRGLADSYKGLGDAEKQIFYLEKASEATLSEKQRQLLREDAERLRASSRDSSDQ